MRICQDDGEWGPCLDEMDFRSLMRYATVWTMIVMVSETKILEAEAISSRCTMCSWNRDLPHGGSLRCGPVELVCDAIDCPNEACDGEDNDCDGRTDESERQVPLNEPCYSGSPDTSDVGACRAGVESAKTVNMAHVVGRSFLRMKCGRQKVRMRTATVWSMKMGRML